jgi:hypothetical protein
LKDIVKKKGGKYHAELDLSKFSASRIAKFHKATMDVLDALIDYMEDENSRLKEIIKE